MSSRKTCHRCRRLIDGEARICPFCNQEQVIETMDGEQREVTEPSPAPVNPIPTRRDISLTRRIVYAVGAVVGLVGMFFVGWIVYALGQPDSQKTRPEPVQQPRAEQSPAPDLTLVADGSAVPDIGRAYTSRLTESLNEDLPEEFQRRDATALPIAVYERVAEAEKQREEERRARFVDPRDVTQAARPRRRSVEPEPVSTELPTSSDTLGETPGSTPSTGETQAETTRTAEEEPARASQAESQTPLRTRPTPLSQPLPRIVSRTPGSVRVVLTIGSDGEVSNVKILQGMPGVTPQVVSSVNRWKFQPATVNGNPVESTYEVEIVVKPN